MKLHGRIITNPQEEKLLIGIQLYCKILKITYCAVIYYAESSNNVVNVYNDKRISFYDEQYNAWANLAVFH